MTLENTVKLAVLVCLAAICCLFSQEFSRLFKKIFSIKGMPLLLPLALGSWFVFHYDYLVLWALFYVREHLDSINQLFINHLPQKHYVADVILIALLTLASIAPVAVLNFFSYRRTYKPYPYPYLLSTLIWIVCAVLLVSLTPLYYPH